MKKIIGTFTLAVAIVAATLGIPAATNAQSGQNLVGFVGLNDVVSAIDNEKSTVLVSSFLLEPYGPVTQALVRARQRGATVQVWLPGHPYDPEGMVKRANAETQSLLQGAGAKVVFTQFDLHLKSVMVNGATFLDDRNWAKSGKQIILVDRYPADQGAILTSLQGGRGQTALLATIKSDALDREKRIIALGGNPLRVETESFNDGPISQAVAQAVSSGATVEMIVASNEYEKSASEQRLVQQLVAQGGGRLEIRVSDNSEKMAITGSSCWVGSTNGTSGVENQVDWGMEFRGGFCGTLQSEFDGNWAAAHAADSSGTTKRRRRRPSSSTGWNASF